MIPRLAVVLLAASLVTVGGCTRRVIGEDDFFFKWTVRLPADTAELKRRAFSVPVDGGTLRGVFIESPGSRRAVLYFTGNHESVLDWVGEMELIASRYGVDVLGVDYRSVGMSDVAFPAGAETFAVVRADALATHDALRREVKDKEIVAVGFSLGSAIAMHVAAERELAGLVLRAPVSAMTDVPDAVEGTLPWFVRPFVYVSLDERLAGLHPQPVEEAPRITERLLVVHGTRDQNAPLTLGHKLFDTMASTDKRFCEIEGAGHAQVDLIHREDVRTCVDAFFGRASP